MPEQKSFEDLAKDWGVEVPDVSQGTVINTGSTYFQHKAGIYKVIILAFEEKWNKDDGGKKVAAKKGEAGAKPYGVHRFAIVADPEGRLLKDDFTPNENVSYGQLMYNQYVTYDTERQYTNKQLYENFFIDGFPQLSVIQGNKNNFEVVLTNLGFYYGAVATMELQDEYKGKKAKAAFISSLELDDHTLTKEKLAKRKVVADKLTAILNGLRDREEQARKDKKKDGQSGASQVAPEADTDGDDVLDKFS